MKISDICQRFQHSPGAPGVMRGTQCKKVPANLAVNVPSLAGSVQNFLDWLASL